MSSPVTYENGSYPEATNTSGGVTDKVTAVPGKDGKSSAVEVRRTDSNGQSFSFKATRDGRLEMSDDKGYHGQVNDPKIAHEILDAWDKAAASGNISDKDFADLETKMNKGMNKVNNAKPIEQTKDKNGNEVYSAHDGKYNVSETRDTSSHGKRHADGTNPETVTAKARTGQSVSVHEDGHIDIVGKDGKTVSIENEKLAANIKTTFENALRNGGITPEDMDKITTFAQKAVNIEHGEHSPGNNAKTTQPSQGAGISH